MSRFPRYNLPGLLSYPQAAQAAAVGGLGRQNRLNKARQALGLVKEGVDAYSNRLNALQRQLSDVSGGTSSEPYDTTATGPAATDTGSDSGSSSSSGSAASSTGPEPTTPPPAEAPVQLTLSQIHHLFEVIDRKGGVLNRRGVPYTSDVTDAQERIYPSTDFVAPDDVEDAWHRWDKDRVKDAFRHRTRVRHGERPRGGEFGREREGTRLALRRLHHLFEILERRGAGLNEFGVPPAHLVIAVQQERFPSTAPVTPREIERAWHAWEDVDAKRSFWRRSQGRARRDRDEREDDDYEERRGYEVEGYEAAGYEHEEHGPRHEEYEYEYEGPEHHHRRPTRYRIQKLFKDLTAQGRRLNAFGFPYTYQVREEQQDRYPHTRPVTANEVLDAWDDWDDTDKQAFIAAQRPQVEDDEGDDDGSKGTTPLTLGQAHHLFEFLAYSGAELNRRGVPHTHHIRHLQKQAYPNTQPLTTPDIEDAWATWNDYEAKLSFQPEHGGAGYELREWAGPERLEERRRFERGREREHETSSGYETTGHAFEGEEGEAEPYRPERGEARRRRDVERAEEETESVEEIELPEEDDLLFLVFDEMLLEADRKKAFTANHLPRLEEVNRRLEARRGPRFEHPALLQKWADYQAAAARLRADVRSRRRGGRETRREREQDRD
jgi:hypothetical protein